MSVIKKILEWIGLKKVEIRHRKEWSDNDMEVLKLYVENNMADEFIAERLGRTRRAIQQKRYELRKNRK